MNLPLKRNILLFLLVHVVLLRGGSADDEANKKRSMDPNVWRAIHKSSTQSCREELTKISAMIEESQVFPKRLPHFCPLDDVAKLGEFVGCFLMEGHYATLRGPLDSFPKDNTPLKCVNYCMKLGHAYGGLLGVLRGAECHCTTDDHFFDGGIQPIHRCLELPCPGNISIACGGAAAALIYRTGIAKLTTSNFAASMLYSLAATLQSGSAQRNSSRTMTRIVFLLNISGRGSRQIRRMLNLLYSPKHYFYIHVDLRHEYLYQQLLPLESVVSNVRLKRRRYATIWGGMGIYHAVLDSIRDLFETFSAWEWDFLTNLSESDLPLLPVEEMAEYLNEHRDMNFLELGTGWRNKQQRHAALDSIFHECGQRTFLIGQRVFPENLRALGGQDYFTLNRKFLHYVTYSTDDLVLGLKRHFNYSIIPLEHFFHTLLINSEFCASLAGSALRFINFQATRHCSCRFDHIDFCACSPSVVRKWDYETVHRNMALFHLWFLGRKFDPIIDPAAISFIDRKNLRVAGRTNDACVNIAESGDLKERLLGQEQRRFSLPKRAVQSRTGDRYWLNDLDLTQSMHDSVDSPKAIYAHSLARLALASQGFMPYRLLNASMPNFPCAAGDVKQIRLVQLNIGKHAKSAGINLLTSFVVSCTARRSWSNLFKLWLSSSASFFMEASFQAAKHGRVVAVGGPLVNIDVGSQFDGTEGIFRNYIGALTITDRPSVKLVFKPHTVDLVLVIQWLNPQRIPRGYERLHITTHIHDTTVASEFTPLPWTENERNSSGCTPNEKYPLSPFGIWRVEVLHAFTNAILGYAEFPVLPLRASMQVSLSHASFASGLPTQLNHSKTVWQTSAADASNDTYIMGCKDIFTRSLRTAPLRFEEAVDAILMNFHTKPTHLCLLTSPEASLQNITREPVSAYCPAALSRSSVKVEDCNDAVWSSFAEDPKSIFDPDYFENTE